METDIEAENRRKEDLENNARKLKRWLENTPGEIRIGIKQAEDMNFDFSDEGVAALYKNGIFVDVVIRNVKEDDFLPERFKR